MRNGQGRETHRNARDDEGDEAGIDEREHAAYERGHEEGPIEPVSHGSTQPQPGGTGNPEAEPASPAADYPCGT
jgi:hypothetical protein